MANREMLRTVGKKITVSQFAEMLQFAVPVILNTVNGTDGRKAVSLTSSGSNTALCTNYCIHVRLSDSRSHSKIAFLCYCKLSHSAPVC